MKRRGHVFCTLAASGLLVTATPGAADVVRLDLATELDSNVHRVDGQDDAAPGMLTRLTAAGRGQRAWGDLGAWANARLGLRRALEAELDDENAATVGGEAGASLRTADNVRWLLRGRALAYAGTSSTSAVRDVAMGSGDAAVILGDASGHHAWARAGVEGVVLPDVADSSYRGTTFETGWAWSKDDEAEVAQWQASLSYERALRTFEGVGLIEGCVGGAAAACATATTEPRRDDVHTLAATVQRSQRVIWGLGYNLSHQRSTLERLSSWRHSAHASVTGRVAGKLFATARVRLQYDRYPDGNALYENSEQVTDGNLLESDQRNEGMLLLAYRASRALSVEALVYVWRDGFGVGDRSYQRLLASVGVGYAFGADK